MPSSSHPNNAAGTASARSRPTLEIIPDNRFIVFHGGEYEASPCKLTGVVRLTTPESMSIAKPRIRLQGNRRIGWWYFGHLSASESLDKKTFWNEEQKLGGLARTHKMKAGVMEWAFEFDLSPSMPESVEGLNNSYVVYRLHASVSRPGWNAKELVASEHVRIVRTLGPESMQMAQSRVNADLWANKLSYCISIPTDAVVFGTSISADVELSPIKKGLQLGKIDMRLIETVVKRIQYGEISEGRADRTKSEETEVARSDMDFPHDSKVTYDDEDLENPTMRDEMYRFKAVLPLPSSLSECRQDVDSHPIKITHRLKLAVNLINPEGHVSQLVCRLPVKIFISPNLPLNELNEVCRPANGITDEALNNAETTVAAPPQYGQHQLDELFSDIDPNNYLTRPPSRSGSSSDHDSNSRSSSQDGLDNDTSGTTAQTSGQRSSANHHNVSPAQLQVRLANLQQNGHTFDNNNNNLRRTDSTPASPRDSAYEQSAEARQADYDILDLCRVPSYGQAVRTPGTVTPLREIPPTYFEATSRPPSPSHRPLPANLADVPDWGNGGEEDSMLRLSPGSHRSPVPLHGESRLRTALTEG